LHRERKVDLEDCLDHIVGMMEIKRSKYTKKLNKDPIALANSLAAVEIKDK